MNRDPVFASMRFQCGRALASFVGVLPACEHCLSRVVCVACALEDPAVCFIWSFILMFVSPCL